MEIGLIEEFVDGVRPAWGTLCCEELSWQVSNWITQEMQTLSR